MNNSNHFDENDDTFESKKKKKKNNDADEIQNEPLPPPKEHPQAFNTAQLIKIFGVSARSIRRWRQSKKLKSFNIGQRVFFHRKDVEALMNGDETP
jgi:hypothetical protein